MDSASASDLKDFQVVHRDGVRLRAGADAEAAVIRIVPVGELLRARRLKASAWLEVPEEKGFVLSALETGLDCGYALLSELEDEEEPSAWGVAFAGGVNVRAASSSAAPRLGVLPVGTEIRAKRRGAWLQVLTVTKTASDARPAARPQLSLPGLARGDASEKPGQRTDSAPPKVASNIKVAVAFKSDSRKNPQQLAVGLSGRVMASHSDGDLLVRFEGIADAQWISPLNVAKLEAQVQELKCWKVLKSCYVRSEPSTSSRVLAAKVAGDLVTGELVSGWVTLASERGHIVERTDASVLLAEHQEAPRGPSLAEVLRGSRGFVRISAESGLALMRESQRYWEVTWQDGVRVRERPAVNAPEIRVAPCGERLLGSRSGVTFSGDWLELPQGGGFMMVANNGLRLMAPVQPGGLPNASPRDGPVEPVLLSAHGSARQKTIKNGVPRPTDDAKNGPADLRTSADAGEEARIDFLAHGAIEEAPPKATPALPNTPETCTSVVVAQCKTSKSGIEAPESGVDLR